MLAGAVVALTSFAGAAPALADSNVHLLMDQNSAFAILGHSCGGIQEQVTAAGFDPATGLPQTSVYISTTCGGSGKGGGGGHTTYSATEFETWNFDGSEVSIAATGTGSGVFTDLHGDSLVQQGTQAYANALPVAAPTNLTDVKSGGQYLVSWTPDPTAPADLISSSTITATPTTGTSPVVTTTVSGPASSGLLGPLNPNTTYQITVVDSDAGGPGGTSQPITITTGPSVLRPGAPTGLTGTWTSPGNNPDPLVITWNPGVPGDSPIDKYQVLGLASGGGFFVVTDGGTSPTDTISTLDDGLNWYILIRAHDAAGWGRWALLKVPAASD